MPSLITIILVLNSPPSLLFSTRSYYIMSKIRLQDQAFL